MIEIDKKKTIALSGHRTLDEDFSIELLKETIEKKIADGYTVFLNGMALGFDAVSLFIIDEIRKKTNKEIKIIGCIPCPEQSKKYNDGQKKEYDKMLSLIDEKIIIKEQYTKYCMFERNRFLIDNASELITYYKTKKGGTFYTVNYAKKQGLKIINVIRKPLLENL